MGKVMSVVSRKANRFNAENRAQRVLERDKPIPAPKYESNLEDLKRAVELDPQLVDKLNKKDNTLDTRLKSVYVTSAEGAIDFRNKRNANGDDRPLPLGREAPDDFEYGFKEPQRVTLGRFTLRQAMQFITDNQSDPEVWTKKKIAEDYKLKEEVVENVLKYFKTFSVYIPDRGTKQSLLTQTKSKMLGKTDTSDKKDST